MGRAVPGREAERPWSRSAGRSTTACRPTHDGRRRTSARASAWAGRRTGPASGRSGVGTGVAAAAEARRWPGGGARPAGVGTHAAATRTRTARMAGRRRTVMAVILTDATSHGDGDRWRSRPRSRMPCGRSAAAGVASRPASAPAARTRRPGRGPRRRVATRSRPPRLATKHARSAASRTSVGRRAVVREGRDADRGADPGRRGLRPASRARSATLQRRRRRRCAGSRNANSSPP